MKFNSLIPELMVTNLQRSVKFYTHLLGFTIEYSRERFVFLSFQESQLMISENDAWNTGKLKFPFGRGINLQIEVKTISPLIQSLQRSKYPLFRDTQDNWYQQNDKLLGNREFLVQDPDGYLLRFFQSLGAKKLDHQNFKDA